MSAGSAGVEVFCLQVVLTFAHLMRLFSCQLCFCFVLQFIEHAALGAVELTEQISSRAAEWLLSRHDDRQPTARAHVMSLQS